MSIQAILYNKGSNVVTISPKASIRAAAHKLNEKKIAALVVTDGESILGLVSEQEIVRAYSRHGAAVEGMSVRDIADTNTIAVAPSDSLKRAMALMTRHRKRHLPVIREGKLAGIVSLGDVVKHRLEDLELETNVLRDAYIAVH
jgi:CBS domain-containing protein